MSTVLRQWLRESVNTAGKLLSHSLRRRRIGDGTERHLTFFLSNERSVREDAEGLARVAPTAHTSTRDRHSTRCVKRERPAPLHKARPIGLAASRSKENALRGLPKRNPQS